MSYQHMDHARWMESNNQAINRVNAAKKRTKTPPPPLPEELSEFQKRVVDIVGIVGNGIYNAPISQKIDWNYGGRGVAVIWHREMSTWDFNQLTMLVFLCHEARIRCSIESAGPKMMRMCFFQRKDDGGMSVRHPNLDEAVADFRQYLPVEHRIIYRKSPAAEEESK